MMKNSFMLLLLALLTACASASPQNQTVSSPAPTDETNISPSENLPSTPASYMTNQENELQQALTGTSFRVIRHNNILAIILSGEGVFAPNEDQLTVATKEILKKTATILSRYKKTRISVIGYADSGQPAKDHQTSEKRAEAVAAQLKQAAPIAPVRFWVEGSNTETADALKVQADLIKNNHVDIILIPTFIQ
ncbi:MAG: OmpA family protein [Alphaproteobacteria bacterium]|nr:OmpA family protein [Alphaproteobacteria bacterium]